MSRLEEMMVLIEREVKPLMAEREKLEQALNGMIGLVQMLSRNEDIPAAIRARMTTNHRFKEAQTCFPETDWSEYGLESPTKPGAES